MAAGHVSPSMKVSSIAMLGSLSARAPPQEAARYIDLPIQMIDVETASAKPASIDRVIATCQGRPSYLTFDLDVMDIAAAPAVGVPVPGGFTTREAFSLLRRLSAIPLIGADLVEYVPVHDPSEVTGVLSVYLAQALLQCIACARQTE